MEIRTVVSIYPINYGRFKFIEENPILQSAVFFFDRPHKPLGFSVSLRIAKACKNMIDVGFRTISYKSQTRRLTTVVTDKVQSMTSDSVLKLIVLRHIQSADPISGFALQAYMISDDLFRIPIQNDRDVSPAGHGFDLGHINAEALVGRSALGFGLIRRRAFKCLFFRQSKSFVFIRS